MALEFSTPQCKLPFILGSVRPSSRSFDSLQVSDYITNGQTHKGTKRSWNDTRCLCRRVGEHWKYTLEFELLACIALAQESVGNF